MPRKKTSQIDDILALPNTKLIKGKPYVIVTQRQPNGKQKDKTRRVHSVDEAIRAIAELKAEFEDRGPSAVDGDRMTFLQLVTEYEKHKKKIPKWYAEPMKEYFGQKKIRLITYGDIQQFKLAREAVKRKVRDPADRTKKIEIDRKASSVNRELEWLRTVLLFAHRYEWILRNPFTRGAVPLIRKSQEESRVRIPSPDEEAAILAQCVDRRAHLRPILIAAKDTGLRKSALLSLQWSAVTFKFENDTWTIGDFLRIPSGNRYKKRPKVMGITARLKVELEALWKESKKDPNAPIFGGIKDPKKAYATACEAAGVKDLHFHDWRHGYATDMAEAGVEERIAMMATGHTSAETHAIYTNLDERLAKMVAERLDELHRSRQGSAQAEKYLTRSAAGS